MVRIGIWTGAALIGIAPAVAAPQAGPAPATPAASTTSQAGATAGSVAQPGGWGQGGWQSGSTPAPAALSATPAPAATAPVAGAAASAPIVTTYHPDANTTVTRVDQPGPMPAIPEGAQLAGGSVLSATPGRIITTTTTRIEYVKSDEGGVARKAPARKPRSRRH